MKYYGVCVIASLAMIMKKELRLKVYNKYDMQCSYCGKNIEYKDMQVDHIIPKERFHIYKHKLDYTVDDFKNLNPSCRSCNHYKMSYMLEEFRRLMKKLPERIQAHSINKVAINFGIIKLKQFDGKFWFEVYEDIWKGTVRNKIS